MPKAMPSESPTALPIASPAKAANSVSRVATGIERSASASASAARIALGGARLSLCRWVRRAHSSNASISASGNISGLVRSMLNVRSP